MAPERIDYLRGRIARLERALGEIADAAKPNVPAPTIERMALEALYGPMTEPLPAGETRPEGCNMRAMDEGKRTIPQFCVLCGPGPCHYACLAPEPAKSGRDETGSAQDR